MEAGPIMPIDTIFGLSSLVYIKEISPLRKQTSHLSFGNFSKYISKAEVHTSFGCKFQGNRAPSSIH
jgi:hypothetical protein